MKLTKINQETIILFNKSESCAEIYTHNTKFKNKIQRFIDKRPNLVICKNEEHGSINIIIPKNLLKIGMRDQLVSRSD